MDAVKRQGLSDPERLMISTIVEQDRAKEMLRQSAVTGWRTALALAVQYGARASEKAARAAIAELGEQP